MQNFKLVFFCLFFLSAICAVKKEPLSTTCVGSSCCDLVSYCLCDLNNNQNHEWNQDSSCPFPNCAYGYEFDSISKNCVKYLSGSNNFQHTAYSSLAQCLQDVSRSSQTHCSSPLESAWRECKTTFQVSP